MTSQTATLVKLSLQGYQLFSISNNIFFQFSD